MPRAVSVSQCDVTWQTNATCRLPAQYRFTPTQRLRRKSDFDHAYKEGRRFGDPMFGLVVRPNAASVPRLGLAIAAKTIGNAVRRNRIKRLIRESFRHHQHELPAMDIVVNARAAARDADRAKLVASLEQHWRRIQHTCGGSSSR